MSSDRPPTPVAGAPADESPSSATESSPNLDDDALHLRDDGVLDQARDLFNAALETFQSSLVLFKAELRLARSSLLMLLLMSGAMVVVTVGAWLSLLALIAAGVYQLTGNWFVGIATVAILNAVGIFWAYSIIKRCLHDMGMPRTRRMLAGLPPSAPDSTELGS